MWRKADNWLIVPFNRIQCLYVSCPWLQICMIHSSVNLLSFRTWMTSPPYLAKTYTEVWWLLMQRKELSSQLFLLQTKIHQWVWTNRCVTLWCTWIGKREKLCLEVFNIHPNILKEGFQDCDALISATVLSVCSFCIIRFDCNRDLDPVALDSITLPHFCLNISEQVSSWTFLPLLRLVSSLRMIDFFALDMLNCHSPHCCCNSVSQENGLTERRNRFPSS